jgi:hypothetical protein
MPDDKSKTPDPPATEEQEQQELETGEGAVLEQLADEAAELTELLIEGLGIKPEYAARLAVLATTEPATSELSEAEPAPTIGRIVHWHYESGTYPAIVTKVYQKTLAVDLAVFGSPFGTYASRLGVMPGKPGQKNTWSWPERS